MIKNFTFILPPLIILSIFSGCNKSSTDPINQSPIATLSATGNSATVGQSIIFDAIQSFDNDGDIVGYEWRDENGKLLTTESSFNRLFTSEGEYVMNLTVTDDKGATATETITVSVQKIDKNNTPPVETTSNTPPVALGTASATDIISGETVHFEDDGSYDSDGEIVKYEWRDMDGILLSSSKVLDRALYYNPQYDFNNDGTTRYVKTLYVTDNHGNVSSIDFEVFAHKANEAPTVTAGADQDVIFGTNVTLSATADDTDGSVVSYTWREEGSITVLATTASFSINTLAVGTHTFTVTVTDDDAAETTDTVIVEVHLTGGF